jgi:hypothetical protein
MQPDAIAKLRAMPTLELSSIRALSDGLRDTLATFNVEHVMLEELLYEVADEARCELERREVARHLDSEQP